jgi:hypothetical protein
VWRCFAGGGALESTALFWGRISFTIYCIDLSLLLLYDGFLWTINGGVFLRVFLIVSFLGIFVEALTNDVLNFQLWLGFVELWLGFVDLL